MSKFGNSDEERIALARLLEDLEDAYGPIINRARRTPGCTDIARNSDGRVWLTIAGELECSDKILSENACKRIISIVADIDGQQLVQASLNANLPTGERFAALLPPTVDGITFSIRVPPSKVYTLDDYVEAGMMTERQRELIRRAIAGRENILIVGGTGAGKTTLANGCLAEPGYVQARTCIGQDVKELKCSGSNIVSAITGAMSMKEIVREFLRHHPDRIVIGEIRDGIVANDWIDACNTGHPGGLSTVHANSAREGLDRIASLIGREVKNVPYHDIASAIGLVVFIAKKDGKRQVVEIVEPLDYRKGRFLCERVDVVEEDTEDDYDDRGPLDLDGWPDND